MQWWLLSTVYKTWAPLSLLSIPPLFRLQSPSSPYVFIYLSRLPGRSQMFLDCRHARLLSLSPGTVTQSSHSAFRLRHHTLCSKAELGVSLLLCLCEGHLYQSPSCPNNYLGVKSNPHGLRYRHISAVYGSNVPP